MKIPASKVEKLFAELPDETPILLCYGPDEGQTQLRARGVWEVWQKAHGAQAERSSFEAEAIVKDPGLLEEALFNLGFFASNRLVVISQATDKLTKLLEALPPLPSSCRLLVLAGDLTPRSSLRLWAENAAQALALPAYKDEPAAVAQYARQFLQRQGIGISEDALSFLSQHLGNDRGVTHQELEKLTLYLGERKEATLEDVGRVIGDASAHTLTEWCHALCDGQLAQADRRFVRLSEEGVEPIVFLRSLQHYCDRLLQLHHHLRSGMTLETACMKLRPPLYSRQMASISRHLRLWDETLAQRALRTLILAETQVKTAASGVARLYTHHVLTHLGRLAAGKARG